MKRRETLQPISCCSFLDCCAREIRKTLDVKCKQEPSCIRPLRLPDTCLIPQFATRGSLYLCSCCEWHRHDFLPWIREIFKQLYLVDDADNIIMEDRVVEVMAFDYASDYDEAPWREADMPAGVCWPMEGGWLSCRMTCFVLAAYMLEYCIEHADDHSYCASVSCNVKDSGICEDGQSFEYGDICEHVFGRRDD